MSERMRLVLAISQEYDSRKLQKYVLHILPMVRIRVFSETSERFHHQANPLTLEKTNVLMQSQTVKTNDGTNQTHYQLLNMEWVDCFMFKYIHFYQKYIHSTFHMKLHHAVKRNYKRYTSP